jgi:hypothetical protein
MLTETHAEHHSDFFFLPLLSQRLHLFSSPSKLLLLLLLLDPLLLCYLGNFCKIHGHFLLVMMALSGLYQRQKLLAC